MIPATPGTDPGRDLSAARACRGGAAPRPAASGKPCTEGRGPRRGHRARRRRTAPRTLRGPGRAPGGVLGLPCPLLPEGGRRARRGSGGGSGRGARDPRSAAHARPLLYLVRRRRRWEPGADGRTRRQPSLTWAEVRGPQGPRLTWQALPSLLPSPPGRGAEVAREGRAGEPGAAGRRLWRGTRGRWASLLSAGKVLLGEGGLKSPKKVGSEGQVGRRKAKWWGDPAGQV